jgi:hypothetical protein
VYIEKEREREKEKKIKKWRPMTKTWGYFSNNFVDFFHIALS